MITAFLIFAREVLEGTLLVSIMLAYLAKTGQSRYRKPVMLGVLAAVAVSVAGAAIIYHTVRAYVDTPLQSVVEGVTYMLAAAILTGMTFWMRSESRHLSGDLRARIDAATASGRSTSAVLFSLALMSVGREGLETAVLTVAIVMVTPFGQFAGGALLGTLLALGMAYAIFAMGQRLDLGRFLSTLGILLMFFAAGLLINAVQDFQALGWVQIGQHVLWNSQNIVSTQTVFGDILHSFLGYTAHPTALQVLTYAVYMGAVLLAWRFAGGVSAARRSTKSA